MIENNKIIKTLELCITAIKAIHPILDPEEPCIAYEATQEARKLIIELLAHNVAVAPDTKQSWICINCKTYNHSASPNCRKCGLCR